MESALPILLFLGFLFAFGLLILICGVKSREDERAEPASSLGDLDLHRLPRFLASPGEMALAHPGAVVVDESDVLRVEEFIREEMALAEDFVDHPCVELLHRQPPEPEPCAAHIERLESYLRGEQAAVANFVSNPSIESLYGRCDAIAAAG